MSEESPKTITEPIYEAPSQEVMAEEKSSSTAKTSANSLTTALLVAAILLLIGLIFVNVRKQKINGSSRHEDLSTAKADLDATRTYLNRQRVEMGLTPLATSGEPIDEIAKRLKKDAETLVLLSSRFQEMLAEKDTVISAKNAELIRSEQMRQSLVQESSRLQSELQRALAASSEGDSLRRSLDLAKGQRDAVSAELTKVRDQLAAQGEMASSADFATLQRQFEESQKAKEFFEKRVKELEAELAKTRLFAKSENELIPEAVQLFRSLRSLEDSKDSDLTSAYSQLGVDLGANVLRTLNFETGSSALTGEDETAIRQQTAEVPDGDLILVIGYASETGNVDANQKLSSDRATATAQMISAIKRPGQLVQAVYLGQTDRFSSRIPERNQICEIWRIRQK